MYFSDQSNQAPGKKKQEHICPKCSFNNHHAAIYCEICFYPLNVSKHMSATSGGTSSQLTLANSKPGNNLQQELRKPSVISGLIILGLTLALWLNYLINLRLTHISADGTEKIALYDSMGQVKDVPSGLFSYGGALYFASLVAHGINDAVMEEHPDFNLRYTQPVNQDQSYTNGIRMLLDGELSFAFNGRSLTDEEYAQAKLRDTELLQVPIAIDGIAFFGNHDLAVDKLSLDQVRDIFTGKINNWQQLGGANLPITPVLLTPENLEILGITDLSVIPEATEYTPNYTLAVRQVIATPGAVSFASASLIQDQQGIKVLSLAEEDSANYVSPLIGGETNLALFENGTYPLTRRLFVVIRQDGTPDQLAGTSYTEMLLSHQGQEIVKASGFVPLYKKW